MWRVLAHIQPGDSVFTLCLRLFHGYPAAVRRHYAEHRYGSMVLANRAPGTAGFSVLIMEWDDLFVIRPWDRRDWARVEIRPDEPAPDHIRRLIESSVPVPRDGALLGWVAGQVVRAMLVAHGRLTEPWDDASAVPGILVLPLAGSQPADRPALTGSPADYMRLWEYLDRGQVADLSALISHRPGRVFWVPNDGRRADQRPGGRIVVTERVGSGSFWLLAGVYADNSAQRESMVPPSARQLLARPGVVDLARGYGSFRPPMRSEPLLTGAMPAST
jgi:hypothetical protein